MNTYTCMHLKAIVWDKLVSWLDNCLGTGIPNEMLLAEFVLIIFSTFYFNILCEETRLYVHV